MPTFKKGDVITWDDASYWFLVISDGTAGASDSTYQLQQIGYVDGIDGIDTSGRGFSPAYNTWASVDHSSPRRFGGADPAVLELISDQLDAEATEGLLDADSIDAFVARCNIRLGDRGHLTGVRSSLDEVMTVRVVLNGPRSNLGDALEDIQSRLEDAFDESVLDCNVDVSIVA